MRVIAAERRQTNHKTLIWRHSLPRKFISGQFLQLVPTHEWSTLVGRVQKCILPSETDRENEIVLGRVSEEETSLRLVRQQFLGLVSVDLSPVERAVDDLTLQKREKLSIRIPGLVTNLFLFCWLFKIKNQGVKVRFQQTHNQGLRQLLTVSWDLCA